MTIPDEFRRCKVDKNVFARYNLSSLLFDFKAFCQSTNFSWYIISNDIDFDLFPSYFNNNLKATEALNF